MAAVRAREYPEAQDGIFLNTASWGLIPASAAGEAADLTLRRNRARGFQESELGAAQRRCRAALAALVNAAPTEIALSPNTSFGVNLAAALLLEGPPGVVVIPQGEFPTNVLPFKALARRGFQLLHVPTAADGNPDERAILSALEHPSAVALAISSVQFSSGAMANVERLGRACRRRGIYYFVDAIQHIGAAPFDVRAVDADIIACGGQKWLCGPWGSGFTWVRPEIVRSFDPPMVSWLATQFGADFESMLDYDMTWRTDARKFELATLGIQDYLGLARSVEVLAEVGIATIRAHVHALHAPIIEWAQGHPGVRIVTPTDPSRRAGILSFVPPESHRTAEALEEAGVVFSVRDGAVRFAPHFYTTLDEIREVVDILERQR